MFKSRLNSPSLFDNGAAKTTKHQYSAEKDHYGAIIC